MKPIFNNVILSEAKDLTLYSILKRKKITKSLSDYLNSIINSVRLFVEGIPIFLRMR